MRPEDPSLRSETAEAAEIARAASGWISREDRGLAAGEKAELAHWLAADPRHAAEFDRLRRTWRQLDTLVADRELRAQSDRVLFRAQARRRSRRRWQRTLLAAAGLVAVVLGARFVRDRAEPDEGSRIAQLPRENYRVLASTLRRTALPDGSLAELNGDSRIEVDYSPEARRVRLLQGEVHFVVAKNPGRPFFVSVGDVTVRAVGTAFNVRLATGKIEVLVTEGKVRLEGTGADPAPSAHVASTAAEAAAEAGPALVVGQKAVITRDAGAAVAAVAVGEVGRAGIDDELGWQSTRLVFNNTPLDEVIAGFNRYNPHRLVLGDPSLRERALTGVFRADNREGFVRLLRASVDVKAVERGALETVLLPVR